MSPSKFLGIPENFSAHGGQVDHMLDVVHWFMIALLIGWTLFFFYGIFRFGIEFIREPDAQLTAFAQATGLHMGQWLTVPMILGGLYLMATAKGRRERIEPTAGTASVA